MTSFVGPLDPDVPTWASDLRGTLPVSSRLRDPDGIRYAIVHRAGGPDWPETAEGLVRELAPHWPGRVCPYWAFVEPSGNVVIASDIETKGAHAAQYNTVGLGIAVIGDFRHHEPTSAQRVALLRLLQWCCDRFERGVEDSRGTFIVGHTELPRASKSSSKRCPGHLLGMDAIRADLRAGAGTMAA